MFTQSLQDLKRHKRPNLKLSRFRPVPLGEGFGKLDGDTRRLKSFRSKHRVLWNTLNSVRTFIESHQSGMKESNSVKEAKKWSQL